MSGQPKISEAVEAGKFAAIGPDQLLYSRRDVAKLLGNVHVCTIIRLEKQGLLRPVRLNKNSPTAQVFFRASDIFALINDRSE